MAKDVETDLLVKCLGDCLAGALVQRAVFRLSVDFVHVDAELSCQGRHRIAIDAGNHCSAKVCCSLVSIRLCRNRSVMQGRLSWKETRCVTTEGEAGTSGEPQHGTRAT